MVRQFMCTWKRTHQNFATETNESTKLTKSTNQVKAVLLLSQHQYSIAITQWFGSMDVPNF